MRTLAITRLADAPGLIVLAIDGSVVSANPAAEVWLEEINASLATGEVPIDVHAVAGRLRRPDSSEAGVPRLRVLTRAGRWVTLHASWLPSDDAHANVAVIIEASTPAEVAPLVMVGLPRSVRSPSWSVRGSRHARSPAASRSP